MNTQEYLQAAKDCLGISSDYALAQRLNVTRSYMSKLQLGKSNMSDDLAQQIAAILKIHPGIVMLDMHRERAATPEQASIWNEIAKGFLTLLLPAKRMTA